ncbi:MAG: hypothetical protein AB1489_42710, partial [Acidobacteriota bacterium]
MVQDFLNGRAAKFAAHFPSFMRADQTGKTLAEIFSALGADLDEAERLLTGVQRSHRLSMVEEERDLFKLAALLGLQPADFLLPRKFYEKRLLNSNNEDGSIQEREEKAYNDYLKQLKDAVTRIVQVMLDGCGTIWALLEGTAIVLNATTIIETGKQRIEHLDKDLPQGGFIHRIAVEYTIVENDKPTHKQGYIYLVENPVIEKSTEDKERRQYEWFRVKRGGFFAGPLVIQITGVADRSVLP